MTRAKRWIITGRRQVVCQDFKFDASAIGPRDVAVRLHVSAISPGTETAIYTGADPAVDQPKGWCRYPWSAGYSGFGEIMRVGSAVDNFKRGDLVVGCFPHASHAIVNLDVPIALAHPDVKPEHAAHARIVSISMTALQVLRADSFGNAGVWGQGLIGNLVAQLLTSAGYRTAAIDPVAARRKIATTCGIDHAFDPTSATFERDIKKFTDGNGFDVIVDTTGHAPTTISLPGKIRLGGQMVLMTHWRSQPTIDASPFIESIFKNSVALHGAHEWYVGRHRGSNWPEIQRQKRGKIQSLMAEGDLKIAPLISHRVRPNQSHDAFEGLAFDKAKWWGVVVDWR